MTNQRIDKIINFIRKNLQEDIPTNNISSGKISGTVESGDDPPIKKKKKRYIYGGTGSRKLWITDKQNG